MRRDTSPPGRRNRSPDRKGNAMVKNLETTIRNYAEGALRAFLEGTQNLKWLLGTIESSGVQGPELAEIFKNLRDYGNRQRHEEAVVACRELGWLP